MTTPTARRTMGLLGLAALTLLALSGEARETRKPAIAKRKAESRKRPTETGNGQRSAASGAPLSAFDKVTRAERKIERALQQRFSGELSQEPLEKSLRELSEGGKLFPLVIEKQTLRDAGIEPDLRISHRFRDVTVEQALSRICEPLGLAWFIQEEVVQVTTKEKAEEVLVTRAYDVAPLVRAKAVAKSHEFFFGTAPFDPSGAAALPADLDVRESDWLIETIKTKTSGPWFDEEGVGGTLNEAGDALVVRQTHKVHAEIDSLLYGLRLAEAKKLNGGAYFVRRRTYPHEKDALVRQRLARTVTLQFVEVPLEQALRKIAKCLDVPVLIDKQSLTDAGVSTTITSVSGDFRNLTVRSVLRLLLRPDGLTFLVEEGLVRVTTKEKAEEFLETALYDVRDLIAAKVDGSTIRNVIMKETSGPWFDDEGVGGLLSVNEDFGVLVVRQTQKVHDEIARLLAGLRKTLFKPGRQPDKAAEAKRPKTEPPKPVVRFYSMDDSERARQLVAVIPVFVAPESWDFPAAAIKMVDNTLIVRQTPAVHRELTKFLRKLDGSDQLRARLDGFGNPGSFPAGFGGGLGGLGQ